MNIIRPLLTLGELSNIRYCGGCRFEKRYYGDEVTHCPLFNADIKWDDEKRTPRPESCRESEVMN